MLSVMCTVRNHSFSTNARFSKKLMGMRNVSFSENFAYVPNKWSFICQRENSEQKYTRRSSANARKYFLEHSKIKLCNKLSFTLKRKQWLVRWKQTINIPHRKITLHKKRNFPLSISAVNVTKPVFSCGFCHIY